MDNLDFGNTMQRHQQVQHRQQQAVAPWFVYMIGTLVGIAAAVFIIQMARAEMAMRKAESQLEDIKTKYKIK